MQRIIPVLLIEDSRLRRDVILSMLDGRPGVRVIAAESPDDALTRLRDFNAQVVLLSADLSSTSSHHVVARVKSAAPEVRVVVHDVHELRDDILDFVVAGVSGFVVKNATPDEVVSTVVTVSEGGEVLPSSIAGSLFARIAQRPESHAVQGTGVSVRLTKREREVVQLIGEGLTNRAIAAQMGLSAFTVKSHVRNIMEKLSLHTRLQLAAFHHRADS